MESLDANSCNNRVDMHLVLFRQWRCQLQRLREQLEPVLIFVPVDVCVLIAAYAMPKGEGQRIQGNVRSADYDEQTDLLWCAIDGWLFAYPSNIYWFHCAPLGGIPDSLWQHGDDLRIAIGKRYGLILSYHKSRNTIRYLRFEKENDEKPVCNKSMQELSLKLPNAVARCQCSSMLITRLAGRVRHSDRRIGGGRHVRVGHSPSFGHMIPHTVSL